MPTRFDWQQFCDQNRIPYETRSSNVAKGHIAVRCPFCGSSDPSQHMGLSLDIRNPVWGCLRDTRHRGRNPGWLVMRLLACSADKAKMIVQGSSVSRYSDDVAIETAKLSRHTSGKLMSWDFEIGGKSRIMKDDLALEEKKGLHFPKEIKPITGKGYSGAFLDFLKSRDFVDPYLPVETADLHYAVSGKFAGRLIFPVRLGGTLVTYTGRDITGTSDIRYKTLSHDEEIISIKHCLYFEDRIAAGGEVLFLTEGPIDALKMNTYLRPDCCATCFFGMPDQAQIMKVLMYAPRWRQMVVLLDPDVPMQRLALRYALSGAHIHMPQIRLPQGVGDPGALSASGVRAMQKMLLR